MIINENNTAPDKDSTKLRQQDRQIRIMKDVIFLVVSAIMVLLFFTTKNSISFVVSQAYIIAALVVTLIKKFKDERNK